MAHQTDLTVRFNEIDPYGHVNHSVYFTYLEVGRTEALAACGMPLRVMAERGYQLVVTHIDARFRLAAMMGEKLQIETEISELRRASGTWTQRVMRGDDVLVTADVTAGVTDSTGKPCKPPEWLFPALESLRSDAPTG
ncbi:MAG: acyl-CoA thioesterase [Acidimicrobiales bacterium]